MVAVTNSYGQDSTWRKKPKVEIMGFADMFYCYDFNEPSGSSRQPFLFNHNRHNKINLNLGLAGFQVIHDKYRVNLGFQTGAYAIDNYAAEPGRLKTIFEAFVGLSLNKKNNLWLDAGIFPSHLGFESAISIENPTLTRSLVAESSPYFLTGAKLTFQPSDKWDLSLTICNGWQRIKRLDGNSLPGFGSQISFKPSDKLTFNWSTYIGSEFPDELRRMRYFNNLYGILNLTKKFNLTVGFDYGIEQVYTKRTDYHEWFSPVLIAQYAFSDRWKTTIRAEYYNDESGVIIPTGTINGFQTLGTSLNVDFIPDENFAFRIEGRYFNSKDSVFELKDNTTYTNSNFFVTFSIARKFSKNFGEN